jgi:hypothetical protein
MTRTLRRCTASSSERKSPPGKQHDLIDVLGKIHRIDREFDYPCCPLTCGRRWRAGTLTVPDEFLKIASQYAHRLAK